MRTNRFVDDKLTGELIRRQSIFSSFMESFNTGVALPPVIAQMHNRITGIEQKLQPPTKPTIKTPVNESVEDLIETVDEREVSRDDFERKAEDTVKELTVMVASLEKLVNEKLKKVELLNASIIQLNKTVDETIRRVQALETRPEASVESVPSGDFATKKELKATENRIINKLTEQIDAEIINAEERFDEKLKTVMEHLDESGEDGEEDSTEEEDIDGVIDMD